MARPARSRSPSLGLDADRAWRAAAATPLTPCRWPQWGSLASLDARASRAASLIASAVVSDGAPLDRPLRVAVIGGGPSGASCAEALAKGGAEVYLIERKMDNAKASRFQLLVPPEARGEPCTSWMGVSLSALSRRPVSARCPRARRPRSITGLILS